MSLRVGGPWASGRGPTGPSLWLMRTRGCLKWIPGNVGDDVVSFRSDFGSAEQCVPQWASRARFSAVSDVLLPAERHCKFPVQAPAGVPAPSHAPTTGSQKDPLSALDLLFPSLFSCLSSSSLSTFHFLFLPLCLCFHVVLSAALPAFLLEGSRCQHIRGCVAPAGEDLAQPRGPGLTPTGGLPGRLQLCCLLAV